MTRYPCFTIVVCTLGALLAAPVVLHAGSYCTSSSYSARNCVASLRWDPVLGRRFITIVNNEHPDWPSITVADTSSLRGVALAASPEALLWRPLHGPAIELPLVRAGQLVKIWKREAMLEVEVTGVAEDNGHLGQEIRVRYSGVGDAAGEHRQQEIIGIVRGVGDVEMAR